MSLSFARLGYADVKEAYYENDFAGIGWFGVFLRVVHPVCVFRRELGLLLNVSLRFEDGGEVCSMNAVSVVE